ncbi:phosphotransferase family protein [Paenibacillus lutimineralis]|uniref:phosphotransferase family protein n=1 Tax=Paenibacillus lutimineralis TaxID=2707005 RepID=UPI001D03B5D9|nr:aminoglycoside phosphotransferase family protein [Paenibacillus lutimineralis]
MSLHFGNSEHIEISLLNSGLFNTTYKLDLNSLQRKLILRVGPVNREYLLNYEQNLMEAECYVYDLLSKNQIPCPVVLAADFSKRFIPRDYMITEYIDSTPLSDESIPNEAKCDIYGQAGKWTSEIHKIVGPQFGRVSDILRGKGHDHWDQFLVSHITEIGEKSLFFGVLDRDIVNRISHVFENIRNIFTSVTTPRLIHADLWAGNVLVHSNNNNSNYELAAIIDADRAIFGDTDFEFANPWMINDSFLKGYGENIDEPNRQLKLDAYKLIYSFIDTFVWKVQYQNKNEYENHKLLTSEILKSLEKQI